MALSLRRSQLIRVFASIWIQIGIGIVASADEYYVLQGVDKTHPDDVLTSQGLDGFTIRVSWRKLHEEGFDWLDQQLARGEQLDVNIQLRVMAGAHAPENLAGVTYFDYLDDSDGTETVRRAPVPWDTALHSRWQALVSQLGARYGGNARVRVAHVPGFANSSEMHMPDEVLQLSGYSSRRLAESWAAMAAPLVAALPQAIVSLNYATPTQSHLEHADAEWLLDKLAMRAGDNAGYQANDLSADVTLDRHKYQTLVAQQELGRLIGFQMVSSSNSSRFGGDFLDAVATASQAGAQWLEIYAADIGNLPPRGDYNFDGTVDAADYTLWRDSLGQIGPALAADGDRSDHIDAEDYQIWKSNFGNSPSGGTAPTVVPEPTAIELLIGIAAIVSKALVPRKLRNRSMFRVQAAICGIRSEPLK